MKYTIKDFKKDFPDDKSCLAHIFKNRYPKGLECPKCQKRDFYPVEGRRSYACSCGYQIYPTEGTIFHKSPTSLVSWFHAIFLMSQSKNGVAAKELERQLGVTYKCAWRIGNQIRKLMQGSADPLSGVVEIDDTYIGGQKKIKVRKGYWTAQGKSIVFGSVERKGRIKVKVVPNRKLRTIKPIVNGDIVPGSKVMTDDFATYRKIGSMGYEHEMVDHVHGEYVRGQAYTNTIEGFWSQMKRSFNGTFHHVSPKHLQAYADEFAFRYDHRQDSVPLPLTMFSRVGKPA